MATSCQSPRAPTLAIGDVLSSPSPLLFRLSQERQKLLVSLSLVILRFDGSSSNFDEQLAANIDAGIDAAWSRPAHH